MEQENDQVKQQSERHLQELQKRRELEQRRADFYAHRQRELESEQEQKKNTREERIKNRQNLEETIRRHRAQEGR